MLEIKPASVIRLLVVVALASLCLSSMWFQIQAKGTYVEGIEREPTLWANYTIDGDVETIELEISNATPLIVYWLERDTIQDTNSSNSSNSENTTNGSAQDENKSDESFLDLSRARIIVKILVTLCCLLELAYVIHPKKITRGVAVGVWFAGLCALTILVPVSVVTGFSSDGMQPGDGFDTDEKNDAEQFAHSAFDSGLDVSPVAIVWSFESEGYDLGLVEEQYRDSVSESPPEEGEVGADSFIRFSGDISIVTSEGVWMWLSVPLFLVLITVLERISIRIFDSINNADDNSVDLDNNGDN
jgi:hypothetical protein